MSTQTLSYCSIKISLRDSAGLTPTCHPGDSLTGKLWIYHSEHTIIADVTLSFQGLARIWVDHENYASAVQYDFLKQSQRFNPQDRQAPKVQHHNCCSVPFEFRIASHCFPNEGLGSQLAVLPPSFAAGQVYLDRHGNPCMQPLIRYGLRAVVSYRLGPRGPRLQAQEFSEIDFSPWTEASPPVSIDDFPGEFCLNCTSDVRRRFFSRCPSGEITVSLKEPPPLALGLLNDGSHTRGLLRVEYTASRTPVNVHPPQWSCEVRVEIIRKIYYSTMPLTEVASDRLMKNNGYLKKRKEAVKSSMWIVDPLCWDQSGSPNECKASIPLTIASKSRLLPTFSMPLVTLRYTLRVSTRILQVSHSDLILEVPLQVHNSQRISRGDVQRESSSQDLTDLAIPQTELPPAYFT